ncbi:MAG: zinc ribbon domain-containing protein [Acidobacteriota bacterium]
MEEKVRCQSCGMPIEASFDNLGTEADGTPSSEYCMFCYQNGGFTDPAQTVDEMVQSSIDFMTANLSFRREEATQMSNDVIRKLKRWN